jgi:outer membrane protein OmpA-like peptidoglycan-associated protein
MAACSKEPNSNDVVVADNGTAMTAPAAGGDANLTMGNPGEAATGAEANRVFFALDSAELTDAGRQQLDRIAGAYAETPGTGITLAGFTDTTGTRPYNQALSGKRAEAVKAYLVGKGVAANEIETEAQGQTGLRVETENNVAEPKNRRVRIEVGDQP